MTEPNKGEEGAMNETQAHTAHTDSQGTAMARLESHAKWIEAGSIWECGEARIDGPGFARDMRAVIAELEKARADLAALTAGPQFFAVAGLVESDLKERYESLRETMDRIEAGLIDAAKIKAIVRAWLDADSSKWGEFERTLDAVIESEGAPGPNKMEAAFKSLYGDLEWMHDAGRSLDHALGEVVWGRGLGRIATMLIAKAYPDLVKFIGPDRQPAPTVSDAIPVFDYSQLAPASEWGDPIPVDGKRPEWIGIGELVDVKWRGDPEWISECVTQGVKAQHVKGWGDVEEIRLPASHPYYLATSRGFTYWPGGDEAPADWDGDATLSRSGVWSPLPPIIKPWRHMGREIDVIGYHRKPEERPTATVATLSGAAAKAVKRLTAHAMAAQAAGLIGAATDMRATCDVIAGLTGEVEAMTLNRDNLRTYLEERTRERDEARDRADAAHRKVERTLRIMRAVVDEAVRLPVDVAEALSVPPGKRTAQQAATEALYHVECTANAIRFVAELATMTDNECEFLDGHELRGIAQLLQVPDDQGERAPTVPRVYTEEDRKRGTAYLATAIFAVGHDTDEKIGVLVDGVGEMLGMRRAGA